MKSGRPAVQCCAVRSPHPGFNDATANRSLYCYKAAGSRNVPSLAVLMLLLSLCVSLTAAVQIGTVSNGTLTATNSDANGTAPSSGTSEEDRQRLVGALLSAGVSESQLASLAASLNVTEARRGEVAERLAETLLALVPDLLAGRGGQELVQSLEPYLGGQGGAGGPPANSVELGGRGVNKTTTKVPEKEAETNKTGGGNMCQTKKPCNPKAVCISIGEKSQQTS